MFISCGDRHGDRCHHGEHGRAGAVTANAIPPSSFNAHAHKTPIWLPAAFTGLLLSTVVASAGRARSRAYLFGRSLVMGLCLTMAASCGGSNNTQVIPPGNNGTAPGSYTVTVYAFTESNVSNGSNNNADASVAIPLTVN